MTLSLEQLYHDPEYPEKNGEIPLKDGEVYSTITRIELEHATVYVQRRVVEITDPLWYHRPLYWLFDKL